MRLKVLDIDEKIDEDKIERFYVRFGSVKASLADLFFNISVIDRIRHITTKVCKVSLDTFLIGNVCGAEVKFGGLGAQSLAKNNFGDDLAEDSVLLLQQNFNHPIVIDSRTRRLCSWYHWFWRLHPTTQFTAEISTCSGDSYGPNPDR